MPRLMDILGWLRIAPWVAEIIEVDLPDCDYLQRLPTTARLTY